MIDGSTYGGIVSEEQTTQSNTPESARKKKRKQPNPIRSPASSKKPKKAITNAKSQQNKRKSQTSQRKRKQKMEDEETEEVAEDDDSLFDSLFREEQAAAVSTIEESESAAELPLSHVVKGPVDNGTQSVDAEITPQIILSSDDIVNQVNMPMNKVSDVTQAMKNVSAQVEIVEEGVKSESTCKSPKGKVKVGKKVKKETSPSKVKKSGSKHRKGVCKKDLRVKRIQTEPSEEFPPMKKKKKKPKPILTTEQKLKAKYDRIRRKRRQKTKLNPDYVYDKHSYVKIEKEENEADNNVDNDDDYEEGYQKFVEEEERKEREREEKKNMVIERPVVYKADGQPRRQRKLKLDPAKSMDCTVCGIKLSSLGSLDGKC